MRTPGGVMALAAQQVPVGDELLLAGFKEQHLLFALQPVRHYPYLLGTGSRPGRRRPGWRPGPGAMCWARPTS